MVGKYLLMTLPFKVKNMGVVGKFFLELDLDPPQQSRKRPDERYFFSTIAKFPIANYKL
jgi:hypothetical protein